MKEAFCKHCGKYKPEYAAVTLFNCHRDCKHENGQCNPINISKIDHCYEFEPKGRIPSEVGKL